jgi:aminopeptidase N
MPIKSISNFSNEWIDSVFYQSLPMSTYTVAFIISDFDCMSATVNNTLSKNVNIQACARKNALVQAEYLFNVSLNLINYYELLFDVAYPLPKMDHVN